MEDGNEATIGSGITHSPTGEQNDEKCGYQTDEAENLHGWRPSLGANLTACRQDNAVASKNLYRRTTAPTCWIAAVPAAEENLTRRRGDAEDVREVLNKKREFPPALSVTTFAARTPLPPSISVGYY